MPELIISMQLSYKHLGNRGSVRTVSGHIHIKKKKNNQEQVDWYLWTNKIWYKTNKFLGNSVPHHILHFITQKMSEYESLLLIFDNIEKKYCP